MEKARKLIAMLEAELLEDCTFSIKVQSTHLKVSVLNRFEFLDEYQQTSFHWEEALNLSVKVTTFEQGVDQLWDRVCGMAGYKAYHCAVGGVNYRGQKLPWYFALTPEVQLGWGAFKDCLLKGGSVEEAYLRYSEAVRGKTFEGKPIRPLGEPPMTDTITKAWHSAAAEIRSLWGKENV